MLLKAPKSCYCKKKAKQILVVMKKHIAILTKLAHFRRHLKNYLSTMQRDRSAYTTWSSTEPQLKALWERKHTLVLPQTNSKQDSETTQLHLEMRTKGMQPS